MKKLPTKTSSNDVVSSNENKLTKSSQNSTSSVNIFTKTKAKEQSPTTTRPSITMAKARIRDLSSNTLYSTSKSRDPSPCEPAKDRYTSTSGYVSSSYSKLYPRSSNKLQVNSFRSRSTSPAVTNMAVSYLNGSDVGGKYRQTAEPINTKTLPEGSSSSEETSTTNNISTSEQTSTEPSVEMIEVVVVTRGTSPNLCSTTTTNFSRCRRVEVAKTIEKTVMRPKRIFVGEDKGVQSDRMDDSTKNSRFSGTRTSSPWPSYMENKYNNLSYPRFSNTSNATSLSKYSNATKNEKESVESSPEKNEQNINFEKSPEKSPEKSSDTQKSSSKSSRESSVSSKSPSISRSNSISKSSTKSEKSKSKSPPSIPSPKSTSSSPTKQKVYSSKALPPQPPKLESPTKVISASSSTSSATSSKWANKDFRKSALNIGQTDRPRKARTSSSNTDNDDSKKLQQKTITNQISFARSDRSPSVSSETSFSSGQDDITKNFMKLKISPPPMNATAIATTPTNSSEVMHLNSNVVTCEMASTANVAVKNQTIESTHTNESCAKIDNAKPSIMNRVLGPVTKIFKTKSQQFGESQNGSDHDSVISANDSVKQDTVIESLLNQTTTNGTNLVCSNNYLADESSWINSTPDEQTTDTQFDQFQSAKAINMRSPLKYIDSGHQLPWWLNEPENDDTIAEDITLNQSDNETTRINSSVDAVDTVDTSQTNPSIPWWMPTEPINMNNAAEQKYRITHVRSGERAWWLDEDTEESVNDILEAAELENDMGPDSGSKFTFKIKKIESGEQAWWLCEENEGETPIESTSQNVENVIDEVNKDECVDIDFWATINESLEAKRMDGKSPEKRIQEQNRYENNDYQYDINANYIPLGDRASPEGLEDLNNSSKGRLSPYDNVNTASVEFSLKKLFISRHQNIDDLLGVSCHALSPIRLNNENDSFEEILPSQVRIHDGTPKTIQINSDRYGDYTLLSYFELIQ